MYRNLFKKNCVFLQGIKPWVESSKISDDKLVETILAF